MQQQQNNPKSKVLQDTGSQMFSSERRRSLEHGKSGTMQKVVLSLRRRHDIKESEQQEAVKLSYNLKVSFHVGFRQHFIVLVFCLLSLRGSGINFSFTYGSDRPLGSIGIRFLASLTEESKENKKQQVKVTNNLTFSILTVF